MLSTTVTFSREQHCVKNVEENWIRSGSRLVGTGGEVKEAMETEKLHALRTRVERSRKDAETVITRKESGDELSVNMLKRQEHGSNGCRKEDERKDRTGDTEEFHQMVKVTVQGIRDPTPLDIEELVEQTSALFLARSGWVFAPLRLPSNLDGD